MVLKLIEKENTDKRQSALEIIRHGSTQPWHGDILIYGEYDFTKDTATNDFQFDIEKILALKMV